jgi:hypothetical protein
MKANNNCLFGIAWMGEKTTGFMVMDTKIILSELLHAIKVEVKSIVQLPNRSLAK